MSSYNNWDGDSDEEEDTNPFIFGGREGSLFLIDASKSMVQPIEDSSYYLQALKCAHSSLINKIISNEKDFLGFVMFGSDKIKNPCDFPNIYVLQDLDQPSADSIKKLECITDDPDCSAGLHGHSNEYNLHDALWVCQKMFSNCPLKLNIMKIYLFTCNDSPHKNDPVKLKQIIQKVKDLKDTNISLDLLPMGEDFNPKMIYHDIMSVFDNFSGINAPSTKYEELMNFVRKKDHDKRTVGKLEFELLSGASLGVAVYSLVRSLGKPKKVYLDRNTNEEVQTIVKQVNGETGDLLLPSDILKYQEYCGKRIKFTQDEVKQMKDFGPGRMKLVGFIPRSYLDPEKFIHPSSFIFPDDSIISGSSKLFLTLLQCCLDKEKMPVCWWIPRRKQGPKYCILIPQMETTDEKGNLIDPSGFHLVNMPFADDVRSLTLSEASFVSASDVEIAKSLIKKLRFTYSVESFENPVIQKIWSSIEALALDRDDNEITDYTLPDVKAMKKKADKELQDFKSLLLSSGGTKRPASSTDVSNKRLKDSSHLDMEGEVKAGKVEKLTVNVLKEYLSSVGVDIRNKKKAELVKDVYQHFNH